ncbi:Coenzyme F420 hydrogenase/dehydrogenase, beta subunit C-terminal domain [Phocaeicola sartorii]|uniref:4Fe-4S ferredoxin-type domain-containing protein n=1 Tax=Phocaeicola sartorii TaxID=671267 RepID=R9IH13_9BACT|nr:Coenzyme F420 hydrogenase/dehydrogenase, beta subunit C-terminal domain [Phocaeicola sartorii]EOS13055.1 hypothetical protein C802_01800 [Phocaeicola sartorii]MCR1846886.1 Coenzyme F420 hydrogenase/dehydrogenase, beta subunit C-terminal domain [Phocaeicola sartorii]NUL00115.1 Coenzyme F420 hydrogenase/dehydrogenase, beta subunit C-terminal domain [Phocaeicola sartorii]
MERITEYCTGCRACEQLCAKKAIRMVADREGFLMATVDGNLCVDCGLCAKRCPQNRKDLLHGKSLATWAVRLKDEHTLYRSASGGAFAGWAAFVISQSGAVFGVKYNEKMRAVHVKVETWEELQPLLSSKYVQSDTGNTFAEVRKLLNEGRLVLYSGTGCQIAALRSFLGKDYDNLILVDLICHGVPSPLLFSRYLELLRKKHGANIDEYDFRDKRGGWGLGYKYKYKNTHKYGTAVSNPYYAYFLQGYTYRECCYRCHYACTERAGDITIADYWGVEKYHPDFYSTKGVSLMLVNTRKGGCFWNQVECDFVCQESKLEYAVKGNQNLKSPTIRTDKIRDYIYDGINSMEVEEYFAARFPLHPSLTQRIKDRMPVGVKLWLKRMKRQWNP